VFEAEEDKSRAWSICDKSKGGRVSIKEFEACAKKIMSKKRIACLKKAKAAKAAWAKAFKGHKRNSSNGLTQKQFASFLNTLKRIRCARRSAGW
jgi:hypothetical protein